MEAASDDDRIFGEAWMLPSSMDGDGECDDLRLRPSIEVRCIMLEFEDVAERGGQF